MSVTLHSIDRKELVKAFILFLLVIFLSNSLTVFYFSELLEDDILWYSRVMTGDFVSYRTPIGLYLEWPLWKMMVAQPNLTHLIYIILFMAPSSFAFYYLCRKYFGLLPLAAFFAAVLPNIIPSMHTLPAYTNGSYIIYLNLIGVTGLLSGLKFLETGKIYYFMIGVALYLVMSLATEYAAMLCLPYILIFFISFGLNKKSLLLSFSYGAISVYTVITTYVVGFTGSSINVYSFDDMLYRFKQGFSFLLPIPYPDDWFYPVFGLFILILIIASYINMKWPDESYCYGSNRAIMPRDNRNYILAIYSLTGVWLVSVSSFTLVSHWFEERYFYLAAFPFSILLVFIVYSIFGYGRLLNGRLASSFIIITIIMSGLLRSINYYEGQKANIEYGEIYFDALQNISVPKDSQLFIIDEKRYHKGVWYYSTSFIQYHSKRMDLSGHIGDEQFNYDNAFLGERNWTGAAVLRAIEYREPFFAYKVDRADGAFNQYRYILRWDKPSKDSSWRIVELGHLDGAMTVRGEGDGWGEYIDMLENLSDLGVSPKDIALAGYPTNNSIERLGLSETDLLPLKLLIKANNR